MNSLRYRHLSSPPLELQELEEGSSVYSGLSANSSRLQSSTPERFLYLDESSSEGEEEYEQEEEREKDSVFIIERSSSPEMKITVPGKGEGGRAEREREREREILNVSWYQSACTLACSVQSFVQASLL